MKLQLRNDIANIKVCNYNRMKKLKIEQDL